MNQLPVNPPSPEQQQKLFGQLYRLCGKQVQSYHRHRHMGSHSSVPVELAQELIKSIEYTVDLVGGAYAHADLEEALQLGQELLRGRLEQANAMLALVESTAPQWQTECRWEALGYLRNYLDQYDHLHLAHKGPDDLFYPILISPPEGIQGIDSCLFYLNILWIENQIMAGVPENVLEQFWDRLPSDALNQCEQLLINGVGKILIGAGLDPLTFHAEEYLQLMPRLMTVTEQDLTSAAKTLCQRLNLKDENACMYAQAVIHQLSMRFTGGTCSFGFGNLFI